MLFTKCTVVLTFCTQYNQCEDNIKFHFSLSIIFKFSILIAWPFALYNKRLINNLRAQRLQNHNKITEYKVN